MRFRRALARRPVAAQGGPRGRPEPPQHSEPLHQRQQAVTSREAALTRLIDL